MVTDFVPLLCRHGAFGILKHFHLLLCKVHDIAADGNHHGLFLFALCAWVQYQPHRGHLSGIPLCKRPQIPAGARLRGIIRDLIDQRLGNLSVFFHAEDKAVQLTGLGIRNPLRRDYLSVVRHLQIIFQDLPAALRRHNRKQVDLISFHIAVRRGLQAFVPPFFIGLRDNFIADIGRRVIVVAEVKDIAELRSRRILYQFIIPAVADVGRNAGILGVGHIPCLINIIWPLRCIFDSKDLSVLHRLMAVQDRIQPVCLKDA